MANGQVLAVNRNAKNLSYSSIEEAFKGFPSYLIDDFYNKQLNINDIALLSDDQTSQITQNTEDIATNADNIDTNTSNISTNTENIATNTADIVTNADNISDNTTDIATNTSAIALADGQLVGNNDFATLSVGGVVNLAANVTDAVITTTEITTSDLGTAPATYSQTYAQQQTDLLNECKTKINSLVSSDVLSVITQLNALLLAEQNANQMA